ncbi:acyltransferase family protein [Dactylosporangium matsuzakiense]|uniref:Acyltransferase 3 domain-containing protein n=1 Tax=Dactylosporangium matsuzakiense TaxID=53360 RepID=A0A9W6NQ43_9ACTN|nr:acyltransferase family protein [Dactylosporangium matsuzakiense]GLL04707.1 hypothetical protein GCM10017581_064540 [Dactylosporangium matsuzakiense]
MLYLQMIGVGSMDRVFSFVILVYFAGFVLAGVARPPRRQPLPLGRVIAVVPAYNENVELLHSAIRSLLNGTVVPDVIHVVDDGSATPLPSFSHPRVVWHRRENGGKHHAQATALLAELDRFDFVVTVDSDSVVDRYAVERCLRPMSDPRVMGVTGVVYALNRADNLITKVTDLHYLHSCLVVRNGLSATGDIFTASGALAAWRSEVVMDNLNEYLERGVADDRHLTHFAQRRGRTAAVPDAYVYTNVPDNVPDLVRQRIRWARDYYRCTVLDIRYLRGWSFWMRTTDFAFMTLAPLFVISALMVFPFAQWNVPWAGLGLWMMFLYAQTFCYVRERQGVRLIDRLMVWLILTPALYLFQVIVVGPAMIAALLNVRHKSWQTRNDKNATVTSAAIRSSRSRYLDTLRTLAIVRVVAFHGTGAAWLGMVFPSMGVMFALAGSLMASSMTKAGDRPEIVIWSRFKRLMPAVWALAAVLIPVMMIMGWGPHDTRPLNAPAVYAWIFPLSDPPSNDWAVPIAGILWYIRTYLWLVIISPALWAGFRRWPRLITILPVALIPIAGQIHFSAWLSDVLGQLGTYAPCWILGFWHATGKLRALGRKTLLIAALCIAAAIGWMQIQPLPNGFIQSNPTAQLLWSAAFIVVLMRFDPPMRFLDRMKPLARLIRAVNARAVTIYLWHQLAILTAVAIAARARVGRLDNYALMLGVKFAIVAVLIIFVCWLMGWIEDLTGPKKRSATTAAGRHQAEVMAALRPAPETDQTMIIPQLPTQPVRASIGADLSGIADTHAGTRS